MLSSIGFRITIEKGNKSELGRIITEQVSGMPATTIDGVFMVGDTSPSDARVDLSQKKVKKIFNRIDSNHDGVLSNSEICDERERYISKAIAKQKRPWNKLWYKLNRNYRKKVDCIMKDLYWEKRMTESFRKLDNIQAEDYRLQYDKLYPMSQKSY